MAALLDDLYELNDHEDQTANQLLQQRLPHLKDFVWTGRPVQGFLFGAVSLVRLIVGVAFVLGGGFAALLLLVTSNGWLALLFGLIFVGVGFYMAIGTLFMDRSNRQRTAYGLTPKGLHIVRRQAVVFHDIQKVAKANVQGRRANGSGMLGLRERRGGTVHITDYTARIPNAEAVLQLIRQLAAEAEVD